ncbi:Rne/Rng family ribonuclease [Aliiroseovarius sp. PTFE2010]|uniref:ribonuclease E/G n=1 Tax=Aliiroseovarius sp. PTFE2010 TaxID=3417190 RepID=UPI003CF691E5
MAKKMLIDATHAEETRVVVVDGNKVEEFDFESENKRQLAGNIYLAKVTRVEPSLQAAFVDYGGNRHGFLAFSEIHPDYYQIPVADREALLAEELAYAEAMAEEEEKPKRSRRRRRSRSKAEEVKSDDAVESTDASIPGMDVVDIDADSEEGTSPAFRVAETPVEEPQDGTDSAADDAAAVDDSDAAVQTADAPGDVEQASDDEAGDEIGDDVTSDEAGDDEVGEDDADDDAAEKDGDIESIADEDVQEEIRQPRKPRPRRYKIQEVVKVRQIMLVQVVKEERGNKGAALTTYLSLAGRYCVLMPNTARGGGISRKITNAVDRKKLKEIASEIDVPKGAGLIVRTAGAKRTKAEIKRDYEYLQRMWEQIRDLTLKSTAPAKIYEEGDLIKRSIRDLYNKDIDEVLVEGEGGYRIAKDFMKMIMPSHAKNVQLYSDQLPLFARYQVESFLNGMFNPVVQLKSGGYIVIGITEALVAVDVNSGRATKEGSIEETALKTNIEAAEEVARQARLRDLAGLIVIDFIDMDERRNNNAVEKRLKDKLKTDRARIQVGRISGFGLLEMSRQRLRPGMLEATTQPCHHCHGTGLIRSDDSLALAILRQLEEEGTRGKSREVLVKAPVSIANYLINNKREHIAQIETRYGMAVRIEADPTLISPDFTVEKFKTATRVVAEVVAPVVSVDSSLMDEIDEEVTEDDDTETGESTESTETTDAAGDDEQAPKKRRRRRRRRGRGRAEDGQGENAQDENAQGETGDGQDASSGDEQANKGEQPAPEDAAETTAVEAKPDSEEAPEQAEDKPKRRRRTRKKPTEDASTEKVEVAEDGTSGDVTPAEPMSDASGTDADAQPDAEEKPKRRRTRKKAEPKADAADAAGDEVDAPTAEEKPKRRRTRKKPEPKADDVSETPVETPAKAADAPTGETAPEAPADQPAAEEKPKRRRTRKKPEPVAATVEEQAQVETVNFETANAAPEPSEPAPATPEPAAAEPALAEPAAPEPATSDAPARPVEDTADAKPKRKGWWSIGR